MDSEEEIKKNLDEEFKPKSSKKKLLISLVAIAIVAVVIILFVPNPVSQLISPSITLSTIGEIQSMTLDFLDEMKNASEDQKQKNLEQMPNLDEIPQGCEYAVEKIIANKDNSGERNGYVEELSCGEGCEIMRIYDFDEEDKVETISFFREESFWNSRHNASNLSVDSCIRKNSGSIKFDELAVTIVSSSIESNIIYIEWASKEVKNTGITADCRSAARIISKAQLTLVITSQIFNAFLESSNLLYSNADFAFDAEELLPKELSSSEFSLEVQQIMEDTFKENFTELYEELKTNFQEAKESESDIIRKMETTTMETISEDIEDGEEYKKYVTMCWDETLKSLKEDNERFVEEQFNKFLQLYNENKYREALPYALIVYGYEIDKGVIE